MYSVLILLFSADSETSNDSGVDSMSGGSVPSDYMDIDEFLLATGVKLANIKEVSTTNTRQKTKETCGSQENSYPSSNCEASQRTQNYVDSQRQYNTRRTGSNELKAANEAAISENSKQSETEYKYHYNPVPVKRKAERQFVSDVEKDDKYWKRRKRNNEAARRSRDMRRQKEIEISMKWKNLEQENVRLKKELQKLKDRANELERQLLMEKQK